MKTKIFEGTIKWTLLEEVDVLGSLHDSAAVVSYMAGAFDAYPEQEQVWVVMMNRKGLPKGRVMISLGSQSSAIVQPREVFRAAMIASASSVIVAHNHPSGDPSPSSADFQITKQLADAGRVVGIELLDHVICGESSADPMGVGHYSFRGAGRL